MIEEEQQFQNLLNRVKNGIIVQRKFPCQKRDMVGRSLS